MERVVDVLVVGAGPAGTTAALILARAGASVVLLDRARFPRPKLCGDTLNPGALAILRRLGLGDATAGAERLEGMRLTGPGGASVEAHYPRGLSGCALPRRDFDQRLLAAALAAGTCFEEQVACEGSIVDAAGGGPMIAGVLARTREHAFQVRARVTIAADGRTSRLASSLHLAARPVTPQRWAIGAYFEGVLGLSALGEMHVRRDHYLGVAPLPGGVANAVLVVPLATARAWGGPFPGLLSRALARDPLLMPRFASARALGPPSILGPLAVNAPRPGCPGLLLAGDAAGFVDPMTGDGIRLALHGGELAALAALAVLERGWHGADEWLARARRRAFGRKLRFNRAMRRLTTSATLVSSLDALAPLAAPLLRRVIAYAGDTGSLEEVQSRESKVERR